MIVFYFIFFWFITSLSLIVSSTLKDAQFNLLNEFFFCLDAFSTTFIIIYLVLFFLVYDLFLIKQLNLKLKIKNNYVYLKSRFIFLTIRNLFYVVVVSFLKRLKAIYLIIGKIILSFFKQRYFTKLFVIWRPLFKRWSYFGLWSKKR